MEEVIVLNWYKRLVNRLFSTSEEVHETNVNDEYEHSPSEVQFEQHERPAFRFPIITDAEIYGWDENDPIKRVEHVEVPLRASKEQQDEFKPTPLYENERWLGDRPGGRVFRAGDKPKYRVDSEEQRFPFPTVRDDLETGLQLRKTEPIKRRSNRPFTPTTVPSPIYGFTPPKKVEKFVEQEIEMTRWLEHEEKEIDVISEIELPSDDSIDENDLQEDIITEEIVQEDMMIKEEVIRVPEQAVSPQIESQPVQEEKVPEKKKERTVPFNVLMLKSDKEKMIKSKPIEKKVQIEQPSPIETGDEEEEPHYAFPSLNYLIPPETQIEDTEWLESQSTKLVEALSHFSVKANIIEAMQGPTVTRFELTVGQGTKVSKIRNLTDDLKLALAAEDIRIQAPIPGKSSIGIEIPNRTTRPVRISEVISTREFRESTSPLEAVLGLSLTGTPVTLDLRKMPHGMIAGATGSGKSVCINSLLVSLLYKASPIDLKMMLIDPKMVELAPFNGIPHLISPVITDVKAATAALKWAVAEMERRYELLAHTGVRDIERYNKVVTESGRFSLKMPYLLIVIDELADLMMMAPADVEISISRITQKARACGIHLIIATQRPSVDVITGTIKANIPTRIAFSVSSQIDSRTIIDTQGAERLLGKGDMLYIGNGQSSASRLQGTFVTDDEIERIIEHVQNEATPTYLFGQEDLLASAVEEEESDPLFEEACLFVYEQESASTSLLQRNFSIGYNRAAKLMDRMEKKGFISEQRGSKARDVYLTENDLNQLTEPIERNI